MHERAAAWLCRGLVPLLVLVGVAGCPDTRRIGPPPRSADEALARLSANFADAAGVYYCKALASFRFRDRDGTSRAFVGYDAAILFGRPRDMRFDIRSLAGVVAQFGSNDERFWVWIDPELRKMWWGLWAEAAGVTPDQLPIPPTDLLDALMLRPLPGERTAVALAPLLRVDNGGRDVRLIYVRVGDGLRPIGLREVRLDVHEPHMPLEITDRDESGGVTMHAEIGGYARVGRDGPWTPRRYVVRWPVSGAEFRLDVSPGAQYRDDDLQGVFQFPAWQGDVERVGAPVSEPAGSEERAEPL